MGQNSRNYGRPVTTRSVRSGCPVTESLDHEPVAATDLFARARTHNISIVDTPLEDLGTEHFHVVQSRVHVEVVSVQILNDFQNALHFVTFKYNRAKTEVTNDSQIFAS